MVFKGRPMMMSSVIVPKATLFSTRLGMTNRYAYDYACEDEFFEKEMTMLDAKLMTLPLPEDFTHVEYDYNELYPSHINDVRFNYLPQNLDRRAFIHDNMVAFYNMNDDYHHGVGYEDEDMDYELPDPYEDMHQKYKRSTVTNYVFGFVVVGLVIGYPTLGLKMPQKDSPTQYRKRFATPSSIQQMQELSMTEYGGKVEKYPDTNVMFSHKGFEQIGTGVRYDIAGYKHLIC